MDFFSVNSAFVHCSWTHKFHFSQFFLLKMGPTVLFTYLKNISLQCFQFQFSVSAKISSIQTDPKSLMWSLESIRKTYYDHVWGSWEKRFLKKISEDLKLSKFINWVQVQVRGYELDCKTFICLLDTRDSFPFGIVFYQFSTSLPYLYVDCFMFIYFFYVLVTCYRLWYLNCQKCDYVID